MKSHIGLEHIRSSSEGRITHTLPAGADEASPESSGAKASAASAPELVPVVVHVEKAALDELLRKDG